MPPGGPGEPPRGPVAVIGDCTLDVTIAPSRPLLPAGDVPAAIRLGPGGQAANMAVRLARRGVPVCLVAAVATDAAGRLLAEALSSEGIELARLPAARSAVVAALLDAAGERTMLSDRQTLDAAAAGEAVAGARWVHCSGYALLDDAAADPLADALGRLPPHVRVSVAGGSMPREPALAGRFRRRLARAGVDLLVLSRDEAMALGADAAHTDPARAAEALADLAAVVVVTAGLRGSAATVGGTVLTEPATATAAPTLDATGAGDGYVAALVAELLPAAWPPDAEALQAAMRSGSALGALVAGVVGAQARVAGEGGA